LLRTRTTGRDAAFNFLENKDLNDGDRQGIEGDRASAGGKGAARAERRAGRVPGVIYGNNQPPVTISVDDADLRQRIWPAGSSPRFTTSISRARSTA
jgi:ribosomal protein L25 (general stress protein Ctc)